ncbi:MAG: serine/threonine protein kinase, partial [bacterium]
MYIKEYQIGTKVYEDVIGSLYLANTADLAKTVYFKILHEKYANQDDLVNAFHKCAEIYCNFENENQVQALEHDQEDGKHYIILEYLNLTPLEKILQKKNVFSIIDAVTTIENIAHIIRTYHLEEIVQGYLTPQNIFIDAELDQIKISDFGFQEFISLVVAKTQGDLFNTLPYYAPELIAGKPQADNRSDIYAIGVLFYRILVGETPWNVRDLNEHVKHPPPASIIPPSLQRLAIPDFLDNVIFESIEPEMEKRYQNISQFIDKISEAKATVLANITPITSQILQAEQRSQSDVTTQPTFSNKQPS